MENVDELLALAAESDVYVCRNCMLGIVFANPEDGAVNAEAGDDIFFLVERLHVEAGESSLIKGSALGVVAGGDGDVVKHMRSGLFLIVSPTQSIKNRKPP